MSDLDELAQRRHELHKNHKSSRPLSRDYELVGIAGEDEFARQFGYLVDKRDLPGGDAGVDFVTPAGTADVKTGRKPYNLIREENKPHAHILVLAGYDDATRSARLIGWEYDAVMLGCPKKDFGYGIVNHYKSAARLRPMSELKTLCGIAGHEA